MTVSVLGGGVWGVKPNVVECCRAPLCNPKTDKKVGGVGGALMGIGFS